MCKKTCCLISFVCFSLVVLANPNSHEQPSFSGVLFTTGDSHSSLFDDSDAYSKVIHIRAVHVNNYHPAAMYTFNLFYAKNVLYENEFNLIKPNDALLFCYGFIDANWLVWKQENNYNRDVDEIIPTLVKNYLDIVLEITARLNIIKIIYNVPPPSDNDYISPYAGSLNERIQYSKKINETLRTECRLRNLEFLDIYDDYCDEIGMLRTELSDGSCHIHTSCNKKILEKLKAILTKYK